MEPRTLEALKGSIQKWEKIVDGSGADFGPSNCPLCKLFWKSVTARPSPYCTGCPVAEKTGEFACRSTPYEEWEGLSDNKVVDDRSREIAIEELNFLKSLLPKNENART